MSITHNKNCTSARSVPQILSVKGERTLSVLFLNFIIIGLCHSATNSLLEIFSFLTVPPEDFLSKKL